MLLKKKQEGQLLERIFGVFIIIAPVVVAVFIYISFNNFSDNRWPTRAQSLPVRNVSESALPIKIVIPKINIDAHIQSVGLTENGTMEVPEKPQDAGWYSFGKRPGEAGNAVIAGHYGIYVDGKGAVFNEINKLSKGDKIFIEDDKGGLVSFAVRETKDYDPTSDATSVFNSSDGKSHLNLITCEGVWNDKTKGYPKRLVIFADKT